MLAALVLLLAMHLPLSAQGRRLLIRVLDERNRQPVVAAVLQLGKQFAQTDAAGTASVPLPSDGKGALHIHAVGYHDEHLAMSRLEASGDSCLVYLRREERLLSGVVVSGARRVVSNNSVSAKVSGEAIERNLGRNLAQLLTEVSGVSTLQTGTTTAKPIIHGMYGTRVLIVNNGVRQSGQQWGEDHAPEVSVDANDEVHVLKGAEAVSYGSEAIAGVVVLGQKPLPYGGGTLQGSLAGSFASNGRRYASLLKLQGALPSYPQLAWRAQVSYNQGGDRSTARYLLENTGTSEFNYALSLGWRREAWQLEGYFSQYQNKTGLLPSGHLKNSNDIQTLIDLGQPQTFRPFSYHIDYPHHDVVHRLYLVKGRYTDDQLGNFSLNASVQTDNREEYNIRRNDRSSFPSLALTLTSYQVDGLWRKHYSRWDTELGLHLRGTDNYNRPGTGIVPIIPNYTELNYAAHVIQKYQTERWGAELGLRVDRLAMAVDGYNIFREHLSERRSFTNLTYSLGGHYHLGHGWQLTSQLGLAFRAPHVHELYSAGNQHGAAIFIKGDRTLRTEQGYKWVSSVAYKGERLRLTLDGYLQLIDGYIYEAPDHKYFQTISGSYPSFSWRQQDAFFRGLDLEASYGLPLGLRYDAKVSLVWANALKTGALFPYIPAPRINQGLSWERKLSSSLELSLGLHHLYVARQTRFDSEIDIADAPPAYDLWGLELSLTKQLPSGSLRFLFSGDNILNRSYKEYTNRARYYSHDAGRDLRASLIWQF